MTSVAVTVKSVRKLPAEDFGDPLIKVFNTEHRWKMAACPKAAEELRWDETHTFDVERVRELTLHVMDEDRFSREPLAEARINVDTLPLQNGPIDQWFDLHRRFQPAGQVRLALNPGFNGVPPMHPAPMRRPRPASPPGSPLKRTQSSSSNRPAKPDARELEQRREIQELQQKIEAQQEKNARLLRQNRAEIQQLQRKVEAEAEELQFQTLLRAARDERHEHERLAARPRITVHEQYMPPTSLRPPVYMTTSYRGEWPLPVSSHPEPSYLRQPYL